MSLDHGLLNLPLSKRGDIDRELDEYKRQQLLLARQQGRAHHAARVAASDARKQAYGLIEALTEARVGELAGTLGVHKRSVRKHLRLSAALYPHQTLAALQKEQGA